MTIDFAVLSDDVPLVVSRQLLQSFAQELGRLEPETQKEIALFTLTQIQPRVVSFEEQVLSACIYSLKVVFCLYKISSWQALVIREKLAALYESEQEWSRAAQMLSGIDLDSGMRYDIDTAAKFYFLFSLCVFLFWIFCGIRAVDENFKLSKCIQIARLYLEVCPTFPIT